MDAVRYSVQEFQIHIVICFATLVFFYFSYRLLHRALDVPSEKRFTIANTATSLIHSSITGSWALVCMIFAIQSGDYIGTTLATQYLNSFVLGFFIYDCIVMFSSRKQMKLAYAFILHHICGFLILGGATWNKIGTNYTCIAEVAEIGNAFLHIRKIMQYQGIKKTNIFYLINSLLTMGTCLVSRLVGFSFIVIRITYYETYIPGKIYEFVIFGNVVAGIFTLVMMKAVISDFKPAKVVEYNGTLVQEKKKE